ncbi:MAG: signal peptidase I [Clostridia bacterium]|nr:signal peptidase I [Clostridia bacterium]
MKDFENEKDLSKENNITENNSNNCGDKNPMSNFADNREETVETIGDKDCSLPVSSGQKVLKEVVSWIACILVAVVFAFVLRNHVFTMVMVDGDSMYPTLKHKERLFTRIISYTPERGDIIIFHPNHNPKTAYVKRVIATEGDRIWIDEMTGDVHLLKKGSDTWEILDEPYINEKIRGNIGIAQKYADDSPENGLLIKDNHVFAMGDNRNNSRDSRDPSVGQISNSTIVGKAIFRWWPLSEFGSVYSENSPEAKALKTVGIWLLIVAVLFVVLAFCNKFFFRLIKVRGDSMSPTFKKSQRLIAARKKYNAGYGDVVAYESETEDGKIFVSRIAAMPGDLVWIDSENGEVYVKKCGENEWNVLDETFSLIPHNEKSDMQNFEPDEQQIREVKDGYLFAVGDNRNKEYMILCKDNQISKDCIIGKIVFRLWPFSKFGKL